MTTPRTRFVKTPNPTKYQPRLKTKLGATTPRRVRHVRSLEDEEIPPGFSRIDQIDAAQVTDYQTAKFYGTSDIEETRAGPSGVSNSSGSSTQEELSVIAQFDELMAMYDYESQDEIDFQTYLLGFVQKQIEIHSLYQKSMAECKRLQEELDKANRDIGDLSNKLNIARKLLDKEKKARRDAEEERNYVEKHIAFVKELLCGDQKVQLPDDTREKLAFLSNASIRSSTGQYCGQNGRLNTISEVNTTEMNSTGSLLSDLSFSRSEDDLDTSAIHSGRAWMKHRPAPPIIEEPTTKKRRSSSGKAVEINANEKIIATTTVSVQKDGPITATSVIESVPQESVEKRKSEPRRESLKEVNQNINIKTPKTPYYGIEKIWPSSSKISHNNNENYNGIKQHNFAQKAMVRPGICGPCNKRIRFGKIYVRCKDCRGVCHTECKDKLPLPCIPQINTPTQKGAIGTIADYAPTTPPMVPALIIHCVNEIELRGLNEVGLYRVPGSEREVKQLKERFLCGKGYPILNDIDIHVVCGVIKDFLRSLHEPIITQYLWREFISASEVREVAQVPKILYGAIAKLPNPNRDSLAYLILHLQKVAQSKECKMPIGNLAKVFGPTIVGYSSQDPDPSVMLMETRQQAVVMEYLLSLPEDFWSKYVNIHTPVKTGTLHQTPSTDSLLMQNGNKGFFTTPYGVRSVQSMRKTKKFFGTPPNK